MEHILCRNCEQGNPAYLRLCGNCSADLFTENEEVSDLPMAEEESAESLQKMVLTAIVISVFTTAFKIWLLYSLKANSHRDFPTISDILLILSPIIAAAVASAKMNKWYRFLLADSILMGIVFVFGFFFFLYGVIK